MEEREERASRDGRERGTETNTRGRARGQRQRENGGCVRAEMIHKCAKDENQKNVLSDSISFIPTALTQWTHFRFVTTPTLSTQQSQALNASISAANRKQNVTFCSVLLNHPSILILRSFPLCSHPLYVCRFAFLRVSGKFAHWDLFC